MERSPTYRTALLAAWALPVLAPAALGYALGYYRWMLLFVMEDGPTEWMSAAVAAWAGIRALGMARSVRDRPTLPLRILGVIAIFLALEELSWGQRLLGWQTPHWLAAINSAGETNIHNLRALACVVPALAIMGTGLVGLLLLPCAWAKTARARLETLGMVMPGPNSFGILVLGLLCIWPLGVNEVGEFLCALAVYNVVEDQTTCVSGWASDALTTLTVFLLAMANAALHMAVLKPALFAIWTGPLNFAGLLALILISACIWQFKKRGAHRILSLPDARTVLLLGVGTGTMFIVPSRQWCWWSICLIAGSVWIHLRRKTSVRLDRKRAVWSAAPALLIAWCVICAIALEVGIRVPPRTDLHAGEHCEYPAPLCFPELEVYFRERPAFFSENADLARHFSCQRNEYYCSFRADDGTYIEGTLLARADSPNGTIYYLGAAPLHYPHNRAAKTLFWLLASSKAVLGPAAVALGVWYVLSLKRQD